jgi:hypothetical protein
MAPPPPKTGDIRIDAVVMLFVGCMMLLYAAVTYVFGEINVVERYTRNIDTYSRQKNPTTFNFLLFLAVTTGIILLFVGTVLLIFA